MGYFDDIVREEHESFGMVGFSRVSGGGRRRLFGSSIREHNTTITLTIMRGIRDHHLYQDWYRGSGELIQVELSAAQFAELLTSMNVGSGVPCTIKHINGEPMAPPPMSTEIEVDKVSEGFRERMKKLANSFKTRESKVEEIMKKPSLNKADRAFVVETFYGVQSELRSNIPFVLEQFTEATERVVTAGKAEVEAFMMSAITQAGLQTLQGKMEEQRQLTEVMDAQDNQE